MLSKDSGASVGYCFASSARNQERFAAAGADATVACRGYLCGKRRSRGDKPRTTLWKLVRILEEFVRVHQLFRVCGLDGLRGLRDRKRAGRCGPDFWLNPTNRSRKRADRPRAKRGLNKQVGSFPRLSPPRISFARNVTVARVIPVTICCAFYVQAQDLVRVCARAEHQSQDRQSKYSHQGNTGRTGWSDVDRILEVKRRVPIPARRSFQELK
jgi:hypothetical protein